MRKFLAVAALLLIAPLSAQAAPIAIGSGWSTFGFGGVGSTWDRTFDFTVGAGEQVRLTVTDAFLSGDRFAVFAGIFPLGLTSMPTSVGAATGNFDLAAADPRWSTGTWVLGAGSYVIRGFVVLSPFNSGAGAARVDRIAVSEPSMLALLGLAGFAGFAFMRRRVTN